MVENERVDAPHVDEGTLHAWLDGALSQSASDAVTAHLASCVACSERAAEARGMIAASTRILSSLDTVPGGVLPRHDLTRPAAREPLRRRGSVRKYTSIAAVLAFAAVGALVIRRSPVPVRQQISQTVAAPQARAKSVVPPKITTPTAPVGIEPSQSRRAVHVADAERATREKVVSPPIETVTVVPAPPEVAARESRVSAPDAGIILRAPSLAATTDAAAPLARSTSSFAKPGVVTGRVTAAESGLPVPNAIVAVAGTNTKAFTDSAGFFTVAEVPVGMRTVYVRRVGFAAGRAEVQVASDQPATLAFALPAASTMLMESVVTGTAQPGGDGFTTLPPSIVGLRQLSSEIAIENGHRVRRTVYVVGSGTQLTLVESHPHALDAGTALNGSAPALSLSGAQKSSASVNSITWVASDGTTLVLSGAVPTAELEEFKRLVVR